MVEFKTLKYKHVILSREILARGDDLEADQFVMSLVTDWDYIDVETGKKIPPGKPNELSIEQYNEVMSEFNLAMNSMADAAVKKTNGDNSHSGLMQSKAENPESQSLPNG